MATTTTYRRYLLRDEGGEEPIEARSMDEAVAEAEVRLRRWAHVEVGPETGTVWLHADVASAEENEDGDPLEVQPVTVTCQPPEPRCCPQGHEHRWERPHRIVGGLEGNPGVRGHGGGVVITEVCMACGWAKETDTWAQDPQTGEQGLYRVRYHRDLAEQIELELERRAQGE